MLAGGRGTRAMWWGGERGRRRTGARVELIRTEGDRQSDGREKEGSMTTRACPALEPGI